MRIVGHSDRDTGDRYTHTTDTTEPCRRWPCFTMAITGCQLQNVAADRGLVGEGYGRRATWSIWTTRCSSSIV